MGFYVTDTECARPVNADPRSKNRVMGSRRSAATRAQFPAPEPVDLHQETRDTSTQTVSGLVCWLSRDPIEEEGGQNLYGFVGNDPVDRRDPFGLEFGITYVQFEGLLGHGWIRTGDFQTYDITTMFAQTITHNGVTYKVNSATAVLPVGIGFYPSVEVTPLQSLLGVPGQWKYEQEKELVALNAKDMLKQWDTELKSRRWFGLRAAIFEYGTAKGKCCKNATRDDVLGCIMDYRDKHPRSTYRLPFLSCRSRAKDALEACCLNVGDRIPTTVGEVRINATPTGGTP